MFHLTFCGFSQVRITEADNTTFTMWGATHIMLPTLAEKIRYIKSVLDQYGKVSDFNLRHTQVISFMGGGAVVEPTIAREIEEMVQLRESGLLSANEFQELWKEAITHSDIDVIDKVSIFGGCGEVIQPRKAEVHDLERIAAKGIISHDELDEMTQILKGKPSASARRNFLQEKLRSIFFPMTSDEPSSLERPPLPKIVSTL